MEKTHEQIAAEIWKRFQNDLEANNCLLNTSFELQPFQVGNEITYKPLIQLQIIPNEQAQKVQNPTKMKVDKPLKLKKLD